MMLAGAGEKFQYLMHDYNDNTVRFVLRYPGIIDPDALYAATKALIGQSDMHSIMEVEIFSYAFRLGGRLMLATLMDSGEDA